jgi:hypothetical protein
MSPSSLPLTLVIVLVECAVGGLWVLLFTQARGDSTPSFIKFSAVMMFVVVVIAFLVAAVVSVDSDVDGYPLRNSFVGDARWALAAVFGASALYAYATVRDHRNAAFALGGLASALGLAQSRAAGQAAAADGGLRDARGNPDLPAVGCKLPAELARRAVDCGPARHARRGRVSRRRRALRPRFPLPSS